MTHDPRAYSPHLLLCAFLIYAVIASICLTSYSGFFYFRLGENEEFLLPASGKYREQHFTAKEEKAVVDRFLDRLKKADEIIDRRNAERAVSYLLVQPSKVPCSIAI